MAIMIGNQGMRPCVISYCDIGLAKDRDILKTESFHNNRSTLTPASVTDQISCSCSCGHDNAKTKYHQRYHIVCFL
ncbi:hypothetical protein BDV41DRAFT_548528 [Aspergillus transmontanensis]|uniref:Uncharacterized protein n=1 Tax=Aspergillus transmontanensis TaxID=1034304 RepID=A0A5N6VKY9_9EURO|nr:hypothetical protein BDV41DRAFT_548528 [Aspergillus transmontanensis]